MRGRLLLLGLLLIARPAVAQLPLDGDGSPAALAASVRSFLVENCPPVLLEDDKHWGQQKEVARGIEWKGKGPIPKVQKSYKKHGVWRRVKVTPINPRDSLVVDVRDMKRVAPDRMQFTTFVALETRVEVEQENWRAGVRFYHGKFRARLRVYVTLNCEVTTKLVRGDTFIPDVVIRLQVLAAQLGYDNFRSEHVGNIGGDLGEWIGDTGHNLLKQLRPSLERNLLEKANAAVVKAADTKEIRVGLGKLFPK